MSNSMRGTKIQTKTKMDTMGEEERAAPDTNGRSVWCPELMRD